MGEPRAKTASRKSFIVFCAIFIACGLICWILGVSIGISRFSSFQALRPEQIQTIQLRTTDEDTGAVHERTLTPDEVSAFMTMISGAHRTFPNHPRGGWSCEVNIATTPPGTSYALVVTATANDNGVLVELYSGRHQMGSGPFRNDSLKPFIEAQFPFLRRPRYQRDW